MRFRRCLLIWLLSAAVAVTCSVPVFRYALEHWPADPFQVAVFHRGPLTAEQTAVLDELRIAEGARPNVVARRVDLDAGDVPPEWAALVAGVPADAKAWLMARFPFSSGIRAPVLSAPFEPDTLRNLIDSPARATLARRIAEGESAVWVLLESGDREADDAAEKLLQDRLDYLASVMTLPKLDESDIANGLVSVPEEDLRLEFSVLRVARDDPAEAAFVSMLLLSEDGLDDIDETMVFPVFGRGRSLYALVGAGIRQETIESAAAFLTGKCSCQVKEQNPGVDLLVKADWDAAAKASPVLDRELPTLGDLVHEEAVEAVQTVTAQAGGESEFPPAARSAAGRMLLIGVIALLSGAGVFLLRRKG
jgi:hypothetical protein